MIYGDALGGVVIYSGNNIVKLYTRVVPLTAVEVEEFGILCGDNKFLYNPR